MRFDEVLGHAHSPLHDREVIRVDHSHDKLGIAAALRQAFADAANDRSDHDFDKLLRELH